MHPKFNIETLEYTHAIIILPHIPRNRIEMNILEVIKTRRSIRKYKLNPIPKKTLRKCARLAAWELGYGTCWIGAFEEDKVRAP